MNHLKIKKLIAAVSLLTMLAGIMVMIGWVFDIPSIQRIIPAFESMRFNAALCFVLFGGALLITQYQTGKYKNILIFSFSALGFLIGLLTLSQDLFSYRLGIDQLFVKDTTIPSYHVPFPGRMAFNASVCFVFLGLGFLTLFVKRSPFKLCSQLFFHAVTILSGTALIGYLYGVSFVNAFLYRTSMATHTAILFLLLSVAASLIDPSTDIVKLFKGNRIGNQMAKRLYTLMIFMVIVFASLRFQTKRLNLVSSIDIGISLAAVGFLALSLLFIWHTANWLNSIDEDRSKAEAEVKRMNAELEKRVEERSAEIKKSEEKYHSLVEQASDAIYVLDSEGNFTDVNASMCKITGYSRDELLQLNLQVIIDPEELKTDPLPDGRNHKWGSVVRERRFMHKKGNVFTVEVNAKMFADDRIVVIARDITDRKKMEIELKEAELKFRTIAEKSMVGVYIVQKGMFSYVNPRFAEIFGYKPEELISVSDPSEKIFHESYHKSIAESVRRRIAGEIETVRYEAVGVKKDGTHNWVKIYGNRVIIGDEPAIIGSMIDITERKKAEEELKLSEQKYKLLFDSNPLPLWMIAKDDLSIIAVNEAAVNLYGYTKDELLNMSVTKLRPTEDLGLQRETYQKEMDSPTDFNIIRHLKKDGTMMFVQIVAHDIIFDGRPVRLSLTNDVTEKLKAAESLQKSEANLQTILNTTDTAYALFDTDLKALAFNQKMNEFVSRQCDDLPEKGDRLFEFFPADKFPQISHFAGIVFKGDNINFEIDYVQADGSVLWYYVRLFPIMDDKKEILGILIALYDITERKNVEQDLKCAYESIQSHIDNIKEMAWKQSHLIRSPLANLKGLTTMLKDDMLNNEILDHIKAELDRMDAILIEMAEDASTQNLHG